LTGGYVDDRPEYGFLREIIAKSQHILERGCYRDPGYQEMFGVTALSEEQWRLLDALLAEFDGDDDGDDGAREVFVCPVTNPEEMTRWQNREIPLALPAVSYVAVYSW